MRRDLHRGQNVHVVQGLGGLGKTAFCYEALKLYKRQGRDVLALWCAEVEQEGDPVSALMRQLSEQATALIGEAWEAIVAAVDQSGDAAAGCATAGDTPDHPPESPATTARTTTAGALSR